MFVPRFYRSESGREVLLDGTDPQQQEWLRGVYTDAALTGQLTPVPDLAHGAAAPTSSRSMSTVMAGMLEALDLQPGHRVLEIGTGTGYNTALLCHRVGADNVTSVELDSRLADTALQALTAVGLTPAVHTEDGLRCFLAYPAGPVSACCARPGGRARAGRTSRRWWSLRATAANRLAAWVWYPISACPVEIPRSGCDAPRLTDQGSYPDASCGRVAGRRHCVLRRLRSSSTSVGVRTSRARRLWVYNARFPAPV